MAFEKGCSLLQVREHPRVTGRVFFRLAGERLNLGRVKREAPVKVDATEASLLEEMIQPVGCEGLCN